jgi:hypothetical protein
MSLEDIQKKQAEVTRAAMAIAEEKDPEKILEMAAKVQKQALELEKMCRALEAAMTPPDFQGKETTVKLTADQKQRITEQTGVGIEVVTVYDNRKKVWSRELPLGRVEPREIEKEALKEAARLKAISVTKTQVEGIIKQLKAVNVPELADFIAELERDPTMGRHKKK